MRGSHFRMAHQFGKLNVGHTAGVLGSEAVPARIEDNLFSGKSSDSGLLPQAGHLPREGVLGIRPSEKIPKDIVLRQMGLLRQMSTETEDGRGQRDDTGSTIHLHRAARDVQSAFVP